MYIYYYFTSKKIQELSCRTYMTDRQEKYWSVTPSVIILIISIILLQLHTMKNINFIFNDELTPTLCSELLIRTRRCAYTDKSIINILKLSENNILRIRITYGKKMISA